MEGERARGGPEQPEGRHPEVRAAVLRLQPGGQPGVPALPAGGAARGRQQGRHQARTHQHRDRQQLEVSAVEFLHIYIYLAPSKHSILKLFLDTKLVSA